MTRHTRSVHGHRGTDDTGPALASDYDDDPGRFAANQRATQRFLSRHNVHADVADRFAVERMRLVADVGGGNGELARLLNGHAITSVVVDRGRYSAEAPTPVVIADACRLPFRDNTFDGAAMLWMLYHLPDPLIALREAERVLRPGGLLAVSVPSRYNDPELASVTPRWGLPLSFDAENGRDLLAQVFDVVEVDRWDAHLLHLPDRDALTLYLRGRGATQPQARAAAQALTPPLAVTKRGMLAWARVT